MGMKTPTHTHTHKGSVPLYPRVWVSGMGTGVQDPCGFTPGVSYVIVSRPVLPGLPRVMGSKGISANRLSGH